MVRGVRIVGEIEEVLWMSIERTFFPRGGLLRGDPLSIHNAQKQPIISILDAILIDFRGGI